MANPPKDRTELLRDKAQYKAGKLSLDDLCKKYQHTKSSMKTLLSRAEQMQKTWEDYKRGTSRQPVQPLGEERPEKRKARKPGTQKTSKPEIQKLEKVTFQLPRNLVKRIKYKAIDQDKRISQVVREVLESHIGET